MRLKKAKPRKSAPWNFLCRATWAAIPTPAALEALAAGGQPQGKEDQKCCSTPLFRYISSSDLGGKSTGLNPAAELQEERIRAVVKTVERCLSIPAPLLPQAPPRARLKHRVHTLSPTICSSFLPNQTHTLGWGTYRSPDLSHLQPKSIRVGL